MKGTLTVQRSGDLLNQTFHDVPEEVFFIAQEQFQRCQEVNLSWIKDDGGKQTYYADQVAGLAFKRDYR